MHVSCCTFVLLLDIPGTSGTHTSGIPDPGPRMSRTKTLSRAQSFAVLDREWPRSPKGFGSRRPGIRQTSELSKQGSTPYALGAGSARPNPKVGAPDPEIGRTPKGAYSTKGRSRLLRTPSGKPSFSEPLLRTLLRTLFYCKTHSNPPSQNPSENPFPRTLPRTFSEPFSERCVAVRPLRRTP